MAKTKTPKPATRLERRGRGRSYYLDGVKVPGVTSIIGDGVPKPALVGWAANVTADYVVDRLATAQGTSGTRIVADELVNDLRALNDDKPKPLRWGSGPLPRGVLSRLLAGVRYADRDAAANRGTQVHRLADALARGEEVEVPEELAGHVDSYIRFLGDWRPTNAILETTVVNRAWGYLGTFDMIAEFPGVWADGPWQGQPIGRGLVDVKTSRSGIFPEVGLQLQAYRFCETMIVDPATGAEEPMPEVDWVGAIHVRADDYDLYPFNVGADPATDPTYLAFLYAKQIAEWNADDGVSSEIRLDSAAPPKGPTP